MDKAREALRQKEDKMAIAIIEETQVSKQIGTIQETIAKSKAKKRETMEFNLSTQKELDLKANKGEIQKDEAIQRQTVTNEVEKKIKEQVEITITIQSQINTLET